VDWRSRNSCIKASSGWIETVRPLALVVHRVRNGQTAQACARKLNDFALLKRNRHLIGAALTRYKQEYEITRNLNTDGSALASTLAA
jgi:hypothetical protein